MKMICLYRSILRGDIVKPGQVLDLSEDECKTDVVKRFFKAAEDAAPADKAGAASAPKAASSGTIAGLTRDQAVAKLRQAGAKIKGNISNQDLAVLYNQTFANIAEAANKQ